jgi:hypothetical protein
MQVVSGLIPLVGTKERKKKMQRQIHGFNFQKLIRAQNGLLTKENHNEKWDMIIDNNLFEIKCSLDGTLALSSLLKFYEIEEPFTWIISRHKNYRIHNIEIINIDVDMLKLIRGNIPIEYVREQYNNLNIKNWPIGTHNECREYCKNIQYIVKNKYNSSITWNKKIDSKGQRRWQCSINNSTYNKLFPRLKTSSIYKNFDYSTISDMRDQNFINILQGKFINEYKI